MSRADLNESGGLLPGENPTRVVWELAWPAVALNSLQVVNTLLDRSFIGHLNDASLTAHGGAINVMFLMFSLAVALATGSAALVSRAFGAKKRPEYRRANREAISLTILSGFLFSGVALLIAPWAAAAVLPPQDTEAIARMVSFTRAYALGLPAICVVQTLAGSLRSIGDTRSPMVISGIQILLHILLNVLFIFPARQIGSLNMPGFNLGLDGAALALSASAWVAALAYLAFAARTPLGPQWRIRLPDKDWALRILRIAIPAGTMSVLRVLSLTFFTVALKLVPNGSSAIAAMGVAIAIESIMFMPSFGLSMASAALVGQSLGMGRPERAEKLAWVAAHHAAIVTFLLAGPIFIAAPMIASSLLGGKAAIEQEAIVLLRYLCVTEILFAYAMVLLGAMQGAGDTKRPMWITMTSLWGLRVPLAYVLALPAGTALAGIPLPFGVALGSTGAWAAMSVTQAVQGFLSIVYFNQGAWKQTKV